MRRSQFQVRDDDNRSQSHTATKAEHPIGPPKLPAAVLQLPPTASAAFFWRRPMLLPVCMVPTMFTLNASADHSSRMTADIDPFLRSQASIEPYRCSPVFGSGRARQTGPAGIVPVIAAATTVLPTAGEKPHPQRNPDTEYFDQNGLPAHVSKLLAPFFRRHTFVPSPGGFL